MRSPEIHREVQQLAARGWPDREIAEWLDVPRRTVSDLRRRPSGAVCPRCWRRVRDIRWNPPVYAELLGFYLGDGHICRAGRTERLRVSCDARYPHIVDRVCALLRAQLAGNCVGCVDADDGGTVVVSAYCSHLSCLFPQHGAGKKHERRIALEAWQQVCVEGWPWEFMRGC